MMKLDEAINHCKEKALSCAESNRECALEHVQLMQWLKELRALRKLVKPEYLQKINMLQKTWRKEWEEYFNRELCYDLSGPFRNRYTESEHEKIKKELIQYLKDNPTNLPNGQYCRDEFFTWIENQSVQNSNPYSGVSFEYNGHTWGMCARDGGVDIGYDKQFIAHINPIREKDEFDNLSKPIDNKEIGCNIGDFMFTAPNHDI